MSKQISRPILQYKENDIQFYVFYENYEKVGNILAPQGNRKNL